MDDEKPPSNNKMAIDEDNRFLSSRYISTSWFQGGFALGRKLVWGVPYISNTFSHSDRDRIIDNLVGLGADKKE